MKRAIAFILATAAVLLTFAVYASAVSIGCGVEVTATGTTAIKTGRLGEKIKLTAEDFKSALSVTNFDSITVTRLPKSSEGTLLLGGRRVKEGQTVKRRALSNLIFVPESRNITEASFEFVMNGVGAESPVTFRLRFIEKGNGAPTVPSAETAAVSVSTQSGITVVGRLSGADPDGDEIEFIPVIYPRRGALIMKNRQTGEYEYTPTGDFIGTDSFSYVVRDEYGNFSEVREVRVTVGERLSPIILSDMNGRGEYNAAVAMCALGVMAHEERGGLCYFAPDERVTRAEFVAMSMKASGIIPTGGLIPFFDDTEDIPEAHRDYVALAASRGIVDGDFSAKGLIFRPNDTVTREEAAVIMARLLNLSTGGEEAVFSPIDGVRPWAVGQVFAMLTLGIFDLDGDEFSGNSPMTRAEVAECLYRLVKVK